MPKPEPPPRRGSGAGLAVCSRYDAAIAFVVMVRPRPVCTCDDPACRERSAHWVRPHIRSAGCPGRVA